jgi:hypothetical protein
MAVVCCTDQQQVFVLPSAAPRHPVKMVPPTAMLSSAAAHCCLCVMMFRQPVIECCWSESDQSDWANSTGPACPCDTGHDACATALHLACFEVGFVTAIADAACCRDGLPVGTTACDQEPLCCLLAAPWPCRCRGRERLFTSALHEQSKDIKARRFRPCVVPTQWIFSSFQRSYLRRALAVARLSSKLTLPLLYRMC